MVVTDLRVVALDMGYHRGGTSVVVTDLRVVALVMGYY